MQPLILLKQYSMYMISLIVSLAVSLCSKGTAFAVPSVMSPSKANPPCMCEAPEIFETEEAKIRDFPVSPQITLREYDVPLDVLQKDAAVSAAEEFGIPPELAFGVMYAESRYTPSVISDDGKNYGIMQINEINFEWLNEKFGFSDFLDYYQNMRSGIYILSLFYEKYEGDIDKVLMCYRFGEFGAQKQWKKGVLTDGYCEKVRAEMERISSGNESGFFLK